MPNVRIRAEKIEAKYLKPGELYSTVGHEYWDHAMTRGEIGITVMIRTYVDADGGDELVYRILIEYLDRDVVMAPQRAMNPLLPPGARR